MATDSGRDQLHQPHQVTRPSDVDATNNTFPKVNATNTNEHGEHPSPQKSIEDAKPAVVLPYIASTLSSPTMSPLSSPTRLTPNSENLPMPSAPFLPSSFLYSPPSSDSTSFSSSSSSSSDLTPSQLKTTTTTTFTTTTATTTTDNKTTDTTAMTIAKAEHPVVDDFFKQDSDLKSNLSKASATSTSVTSSPDQDGKATTTSTTTTTTTTTSASTKSEDSPKKKTGPAVGRKMNPVYKAFRGLLWALYFNLGASLISMTQVLSLPLAILAPGVYRQHINRTEGHFGAFLLKMNQLFAPSDIVLTGDESIRGLVKQPFKGLKEGSVDKDGKESLQLKQGLLDEEVFLDMPERLVLISNHQVTNKSGQGHGVFICAFTFFFFLPMVLGVFLHCGMDHWMVELQ